MGCAMPALARAAAAVTSGAGVCFLAGWVLDLPSIIHIAGHRPVMIPLTALTLALGGLSMLLLAGALSSRRRVFRTWAGRAFAFAVLFVGAATLSEYIFSWDHGLGRLLLASRPGENPLAGRPSHFTSLGFVLTGAALLLLEWKTRLGLRPAQFLALSADLLAGLALTGYIIDYPPFYRTHNDTGMSIQTALALAVLSSGILCARPGGLIEILTSPGPVGLTARRMLPLPLTLTFALSWLALAGNRAGLYGGEMAIWILQFSNIAIFTGLIWLNAGMLHRAEIERRRTRELLSESEQRLRRVFESAPIGIALVDEAGRFERANPALCAMFGYNPEELSRMTLGSITHPDDKAKDLPLRTQLLEGTIGEYRIEKRFLKQSGETAWIQMSMAVIDDPAGRAAGWLALFEDTTERRRTSMQLRQRTEEMERANKELEAFSYSVSHDLRAPLRAIQGFSEILEEECATLLTGKPLKYLRRVREASERMGQLIDDVLAFSRLGRQHPHRTGVSPEKIIAEVLEDLDADRRNREVELSVQPLEPCQADATLLKQVFLNLLSNALKFTRCREVARIEVGTFTDQDELVYFVKDNGDGFDMRYADKLFGVFQRLHRQDEYEGTGVGLAIVQRVVHHHGGRVWAQAAPGEGATFFFTLGVPAAQE